MAADLGLEPQTLRRLEVGWAKAYDAWSFPMFDADHRVVGIRLRRPNGRKFAVRGGREGLFVPTGLPTGIPRLLVAEGPTDTAAILGLGFEAVGRSSCTGGAKLLVTLARGRRVREVVIVADADEPGRRGAESLATALLPYVDVVRVIVPPDGIKDARAWVRAGASAGDVHAAIESAAARRIRLAVASSRGEVRP
ncbi:MAG TPA: toprim domain-containing protein [Humisphaera sp.]